MNIATLDADTGETVIRPMTEKEIAEISSIPAPSFPELPRFPPLSRLTFWLAAAEIGISKERVRMIAQVLPAGIPRDQALAYIDEAQVFRREDPLLNRIATVENITQKQLDDLWDWASEHYP